MLTQEVNRRCVIFLFGAAFCNGLCAAGGAERVTWPPGSQKANMSLSDTSIGHKYTSADHPSRVSGAGRSGITNGQDGYYYRIDRRVEQSPFGPANSSASVYIERRRNIEPRWLAVDPMGNVYVTGVVRSDVGFNTGTSQNDIFITKLDASLNEVHTVYFGGSGSDQVAGIAVAPNGDVCVAGATTSANFPAVNAVQEEFGGDWDGFVSCIGSNGGFSFSTYLGGSAGDGVNAMVISNSGEILVTGGTASVDFPVTEGAFQTTSPPPNSFGSPGDAFVAKLSPDGRRLIYSTRLGGEQTNCFGGSSCIPASSRDSGTALAVDAAGSAYVAGRTNSKDFPTTPGALATECACNFRTPDVFVTKIDPTGSSLIFSTYVPAPPEPVIISSGESVNGLALGSDGSVFITGSTDSTGFPTTEGALNRGFYTDLPFRPVAYAAKLNASGSELLYSTLLSNRGTERTRGIVVDEGGNAYLTGDTQFPTFPTSPGSFPTGSSFFMMLGPDGSQALYSTLLPSDSAGQGIAVSSRGEVHLLGSSGLVSRLSAESLRLPPILGVANAARRRANSRVAPLELVSVFVSGIGPNQPSGLEFDADGNVATTLAGIQIVFNGRPGRLIFVGPHQMDVIVPVQRRAADFGEDVTMEILRQERVIASIVLSGVGTVPGVFRSNESSFLAAALNQDGTINSFENPAASNSVVAVFATGLGLMAQASGQEQLKPRLPVSIVKLSGQEKPVETLFVGQAPGLVEGVVQINLRVPEVLTRRQVLFRLYVGEDSGDSFGLLVRP